MNDSNDSQCNLNTYKNNKTELLLLMGTNKMKSCWKIPQTLRFKELFRLIVMVHSNNVTMNDF